MLLPSFPPNLSFFLLLLPPYSFLLTPSSLLPTPCILLSTFYTFLIYILLYTFYILFVYVLRSTFCIVRSTFYVVQSSVYSLQSTFSDLFPIFHLPLCTSNKQLTIGFLPNLPLCGSSLVGFVSFCKWIQVEKMDYVKVYKRFMRIPHFLPVRKQEGHRYS